MVAYFLAKTEPSSYSIDDLARDGETIWDGVHNAQAIQAIKAMNIGDIVYIYHSQTDKSIVGEARVTSLPFQNQADDRPSWAVKVAFVRKFQCPISLSAMKATPELSDFLLVRNSRLSTMVVPEAVHQWISRQLD
jgi:predicted RNA-binding protein with PUA-like domain